MLISPHKKSVDLFALYNILSYICRVKLKNYTMNRRNNRRAKLKCGMGENLKMDDNVYKLRREVMNYLYEAKNLLRDNGIQMPRVDVRITDNSGTHGQAAGMGRMGANVIWISTMCLDKWKDHVRWVVFHELLHAVLAVGHDEKCPLMKPYFGGKPMSNEVIDKNFLKYFI